MIQELQRLRKELKMVKAQLAIIEQRIGELESELIRAEEPARRLGTKFEAFHAEEATDSTRPKNLTLPFKRVPIARINSPETRPASSNGLEQLTNAFNALANQEGYPAKVARGEFVQRYKVQTFNCVNSEARMSEPVPPPEFVTSTNGEYWAVPLSGNSFLVFPNVKNYSNSYHAERAMGAVFKSNFVAGRTYKKIIVEKPAIFDCNGANWFLKAQGVLRLG